MRLYHGIGTGGEGFLGGVRDLDSWQESSAAA